MSIYINYGKLLDVHSRNYTKMNFCWNLRNLMISNGTFLFHAFARYGCRKLRKPQQLDKPKSKLMRRQQLPQPKRPWSRSTLRKVLPTFHVTPMNCLWAKRRATMTTTRRKCQLEAKDWIRWAKSQEQHQQLLLQLKHAKWAR